MKYITQAQRRKISAAMKNYYASLTPEERKEWQEKRQIAQEKRREKVRLALEKLEQEEAMRELNNTM